MRLDLCFRRMIVLSVGHGRISGLGHLCSCILPWPDQARATVGSSTLRTLCGSCVGAGSRFKSWAQEHCPPQILQQRLQALTFHLISQNKAPLRQQTAGDRAAALLSWAFHHELAASSVNPVVTNTLLQSAVLAPPRSRSLGSARSSLRWRKLRCWGRLFLVLPALEYDMPLPACCLCLCMEHAFHSETSALLAQLPSQLRLFQVLAFPCHGMSYSAYPRQTTGITLLRVERCRITDLGLLCGCILPWSDQASASVGSSTLRTLYGSCVGA